MATTRPHIPRAPYVDPNTNIIYETDNPEYHGWLTKQSMWLKVRKKRTLFFLVLFFGIRSTFKLTNFLVRFLICCCWVSTQKDWRRRYFLLKGSKLFFGKNEWSPPHGMIDLALCTTVKSADLKSRKRNSFEISTPELTYLLYADTEQEKDDWIGRVGKAIVRCSSTYYNSNNNKNTSNNNSSQQQQQSRQGVPSPYGLTPQQQQLMRQQQEEESDDDDIYYEDPNNPNPYFND